MSRVESSNFPPVVGAAKGFSAIAPPPHSLENPALAQASVARQPLSGRAQMVHILTPVSAGGLGGSVGYRGPNDAVTRQISRVEDLPTEAELAQASGDTTQMTDIIKQHEAVIASSTAAIKSLTAAKASIAAPAAPVPAGPTAEEFAALKKQLADANAEKEQARQELAKIEEELATSGSAASAPVAKAKPVATK